MLPYQNIKIKSSLLTTFAVFALGALPAGAVVLSAWNFETNTPADSTDLATGPSVVAESGVFTTGFTATGVHSSTATDWTTPTGNGSLNSLSSNNWTTGDYYQFLSSSAGYTGITITFAQTSSGTGPGEFKFAYQVNGGAYTDFADYTVLPNSATSPGLGTWGSTTEITGYNYSFDLSAITSLNNATSIGFRLIMRTTADAAPPGTVATSGTSRVDNFIVNGVPEPDAAALIGTLGIFSLFRRRR